MFQEHATLCRYARHDLSGFHFLFMGFHGIAQKVGLSGNNDGTLRAVSPLGREPLLSIHSAPWTSNDLQKRTVVRLCTYWSLDFQGCSFKSYSRTSSLPQRPITIPLRFVEESLRDVCSLKRSFDSGNNKTQANVRRKPRGEARMAYKERVKITRVTSSW